MAENYKILGQVESISDSVASLYTVPEGKHAVSSVLSIVNTSSSATQYSVFAVPSSESASILVQTEEGWTQAGQDIDGENSYDESGSSVSLSADGLRLAVGAWQNDNDNGNDSGHVRVYDWNGSNWVQVGADIDGESVGVYSGYSVSLSADGSRVAIGAIYNDGGGNARGHVRIYDWNGFAWNQVGSDIDGENDGDQSGYSVSISADGSRVAIGAPYNSSTITQAGHVRVYELFGGSGGSWVQVGSDIDGGWFYDRSGTSVSLSADGSRVAIGAPFNDGGGNDSGHVRVYQLVDNTWVKLGGDIDGEAAGDESGRSVSLSADGSRVAIGSRYNSDGGFYAGHVRIYDWNGSNWVQAGADIDGENNNDNSGYSVSISADGSRVAIGAIHANNYRGNVRIYEWNGSSWLQVGQNIVGEERTDFNVQYSGYSVSISADGSRVAIGAPNDGEGALYAQGHVRVYDWNDYQFDILPQSKHALINSKAISAGVHDEIVGGIQLSAGDSILVLSPSEDVVFNMYGVETL
jgi:hypothetical protein